MTIMQKRNKRALAFLIAALVVFTLPVPLADGFCAVAYGHRWENALILCGHTIILGYFFFFIVLLFFAIAILLHGESST